MRGLRCAGRGIMVSSDGVEIQKNLLKKHAKKGSKNSTGFDGTRHKPGKW